MGGWAFSLIKARKKVAKEGKGRKERGEGGRISVDESGEQPVGEMVQEARGGAR